jgi:transcriptional antiterminator NusG
MSANWYVIRAIAGQEKKVKQYIESEVDRLKLNAMVEDVMIPTEKVFEMRNGKKRSRERNFMPGYMLINADLQPEVIEAIRDVPGVIGFLGADKGKTPQPLQESEVNKILGQVDEAKDRGEVMENPFVIGEQVKVMDGPFNGFDATIEEIDEDRKRLKVTVKIFGRSTPLELKFLQVERIS